MDESIKKIQDQINSNNLDLEKNTTIGVARNGNKRILSLNLSK